MVNFEKEKNVIRQMFKAIDAVFENDGADIEEIIKDGVFISGFIGLEISHLRITGAFKI